MWNVPAAIAPLKEKRETFVAGLETMILAETNPMKAMNRPMPADTARFQVDGDRVENRFAYIGERQDNENHAFQTNSGKGGLPGIAHLSDDGESEKRIQPHAWSEGEGVIGKECHENGADECGKGGRRKKRLYPCRQRS